MRHRIKLLESFLAEIIFKKKNATKLESFLVFKIGVYGHAPACPQPPGLENLEKQHAGTFWDLL